MIQEEVQQIPAEIQEPENPAELRTPENIPLGVIGALIGAVLGGASIILFGKLGYVSALSGAILAFCTLKGYELLAKGLSKKGIAVCIVLMLVTPFVTDWLDWAMAVQEAYAEYNLTLSEASAVIPALMADGAIAMSDYLINLGMIYLFVVLGGFYTVKKALKK